MPDGYLLPDSDAAPQGPKGLSGSDGTRGAALTVDADATRHTGDVSDYDFEDESADAQVRHASASCLHIRWSALLKLFSWQGSGIRRTHAWKKGDTPHVAALLGKERADDRPAPEAPSLRGDPYFDMVADVRAETRNSVGSKSLTLE